MKPKRPKGEVGYKEETASRIDKISMQTGRSRNERIGKFLDYTLGRCKVEEE